MSTDEPIATHEEFKRHLFMLEQCGHHERVQAAREKGFLIWRREAIEKDLALLKRTMERCYGSIKEGIRTTIHEMESELEELCFLFTHA